VHTARPNDFLAHDKAQQKVVKRLLKNERQPIKSQIGETILCKTKSVIKYETFLVEQKFLKRGKN